jgi:hypothetical protein
MQMNNPFNPSVQLLNYVRFEVLTVVSRKMAVFWVVALCNHVPDVFTASINRMPLS